MRSRKIFLENLLITRAAGSQDVRALLAQSQTVTETTAAKYEVAAGPRHFKSRALQNIPSQDAADDDLKVPAADSSFVFAFERDEFRAPSLVTFADQNLVEPIADVSARDAL